METWEAIRTRRHVRKYQERPIPPADLDQILEAGRVAPSWSNRQARDFVVVTDRDRLAELATVSAGAGHVRGSAASMAFVVPDDDAMIIQYSYDAGQATMLMAIAAVSLGIGSAPAEIGDGERLRQILGLPTNQRCLHVLAFGYPADGPLDLTTKLHRRPFDEVVHRDRW
jgi:nitroreductase